MNGALLVNGLSEEELQALMGRLYGLLAIRTEKYLAGDSTSLPVETAEELLRSIVYTLRLALSEDGLSERELLTRDLEGLLARGQEILQKKLVSARLMRSRACLAAPKIPNVYLRDTLRELGGFFRRYDPWYFAHKIPCAVDYPLCLPVSEELLGVSYVIEWLRRFLVESRLLGAFPAQSVSALLSKITPDYRDYPINLCEQALLNAVGLAMLSRPPLSAELSAGDCRELEKILYGVADMKTELERGVLGAAAALRASPEGADYLRRVAEAALPRFRAAKEAGGLSGIFAAAQ